MTRTLNVRLLLWTLGILLIAGVGLNFLHGHQVRRNTGALLVRGDEARRQGDLNQALDYYLQYLAFEPNDAVALEKYALALAEQAVSAADRVSAVFALDDLLRRNPDNHQIRYKLIRELIELQRFREAIQNLQILLPHWPQPAELEHMLGWCQEALGDYAGAIASFTKAITHDPSRIQSYTLLAEVLQGRQHQAEEAAHVMDDMVRMNDKSFQAYLARSRFRRVIDNLDSAEVDLEQALALAPTDPMVLLAAADLALARGDAVKARKLIDDGWKANPKNPVLIKAMAGLEFQAGRSDRAIALVRDGLKEAPQAVDLLVLLADLLIDEGRLGEASERITELRQTLSGRSLPDFLQARLLISQNKWSEAQSLLEKVRNELGKTSDWSGRVYGLLGLCYEHEGKLDRALEYYQTALKLDERQPRVLARVVQLLVRWRRFVEADQALRRLEEQGPLTLELSRVGAEIALAMQTPDRARTLARKAVDPETSDYRQLIWLAHVYHAAGEDKAAEAMLRRAVSAAPRAPDPLVALVEQLSHTGQREAALEVIEQAKGSLPSNWLLPTLARCYEALGLLDRAEETYREALAPNPDDLGLIAQAAEFLRRADWPEKAAPLWQKLLDPDVAAPRELQLRARRQLALTMAAAGKITEALELIADNERLLGKNIADDRVRNAVEASQPSERNKSLRAFEDSLKRAPATVDELFLLAKLYDTAGNLSRSREILLGLLATQPENPQFLAHYVRVLLKAEELEDAASYLTRLDRLEPGSVRSMELKKLLVK
ncbi:MAG: tetratricopeptide repeat protein [Planctomycetes bacterium]|nr:tetratricopeptide repeat protein [Planctomycetota bacterium]